MEIIDPSTIKVTKKTRNILEYTSTRIEDFSKRKLNEDQKRDLREALLEPQIRISLAIEGINVRSRQTTEILKYYKVNNEIGHGDHQQEIVNLADAMKFIDINKDKEFTQSFVCDVHAIVERNILDSAGYLRDSPVRIKGAKMVPPNPLKLPNLFDDLKLYFDLSDQQDPIVLSVWLHHMLTQMHPFIDGNGRTARLLQDWVLIKNNYFPVSTGSLRRDKYMDLLEDADEKQYDEFIVAMAENQSDVLARAESAVDDSEKTTKDIRKLVSRINKTTDQAIIQEYDHWRFYMNKVVESFQSQCEKLNLEMGVNNTYEIKDKPFACNFLHNDIIESAAYERIKKQGWIQFNSAFKIWWYKNGNPIYFTSAYYARHFLREGYDPASQASFKDKVAIYLGGWNCPAEVDAPIQGFQIKNKYTSQIWTQLPWPDQDIDVREIVFDQGKYFAYYRLPEEKNIPITDGTNFLPEDRSEKHEKWTYKQPKSINEAVSDYLMNIVENKAGF